MIKEPLFQKNIISQILSNLQNYLFYDYWYCYFIAIMLFILGVSWYLNKFLNVKNLSCLDNKINKSYIIFLCISFISYLFVLFSLEPSLFNHSDLMSLGTVKMFYSLDSSLNRLGRVWPLGNFDNNIIYAITHNFYAINIYISLLVCLMIYSLYKLFSFLEPNKRALLISLFILTPSYFWANSMIYPEKFGLLFVFLSLIFLKQERLILFALFMNFAIYSKESYILIYSGLLIYKIAENIYLENLTPKSFLKPIKSMQQMPLESIIFFSTLMFALFFLFSNGELKSSAYIANRTDNAFNAVKIYKIECIINLIAIYYFIKNIKKEKNIFTDGLFVSATFFNIFIIFVLHLIPISSAEDKTYYLQISTLFNLSYIIYYTKKPLVLTFIFVIMFVLQNVYLFNKEEGKSYRAVYNFFITELEDENKLNIHIYENEASSIWTLCAWNSAYKYYLPNADITFKSDIEHYILKNNDFYKVYHEVLFNQKISSSDYVVIKKNKEYNKSIKALLNKEYKKVYDNNLFEVYYIVN